MLTFPERIGIDSASTKTDTKRLGKDMTGSFEVKLALSSLGWARE
jgi:hypothetical protein